MKDFLPQLKRPKRHTAIKMTDRKEISFYLCFDDRGAFVNVIDKKKKKVQADFHAYSGAVSEVLRYLAMIEEKRMKQFAWDGKMPPVYLGDHAGLLYHLLKCNNLFDETGNPIRVSSSVAMPGLAIVPEKKKNSTSFFLKTEEGDIDKFQFLSDSFVLANGVIYPIEPVGINYLQLPLFKTTFDEELLQTYLSVFFSYFDNMDLRYKDYTLKRSTAELKTVPKLVIQKIDSDKTVYMHMERGLPNGNLPDTDRFDLIWLATLTEDREVVLNRIVYEPIESKLFYLKAKIQEYSPDTQAKNEVYRKNNFFIIPPDTAIPFFSNELSSLKNEFVLAGSELLDEYID